MKNRNDDNIIYVHDTVDNESAPVSTDHHLTGFPGSHRAIDTRNVTYISNFERQGITPPVVGAEGGLKSVIEHARLVAPTDAPVLILGETGTGKEVIARMVHRLSRCAKGPMLRVNCGAIPPELIDSQLFGHERGAFTGAVAEQPGWFERANGGTLFLDEVGALTHAAQVRLLRVIQEQVLERVGGRQTVLVDVRIVAATNADLKQMVTKGLFREDLWYRLNVFPICLPPLRERAGDIPALATYFARNVGERLNGFPLVPNESDLAMLLAYPWPGNVRELAAVIERAAILGDGKNLAMAAALGRTSFSPPPRATAILGSTEDPEPLRTLDQVMADHIQAALVRANGKIEGKGGAAELLAINPHTLRARMRKHRIDWNRFRP